MESKEYLFTYGTLQEKNVQFSIFQRYLSGEAAMLPGFVIAKKKVLGQYPVLEHTRNTADLLAGTVYELAPHELILADVYEGTGYQRIEVILQSGKKAWVYAESESN